MHMIKFVSRAAIAGTASAALSYVSVNAKTNAVHGSGSLGGKDTGLDLIEGTAFEVSATGTWQNNPLASYLTDADGHANSTYTYTSTNGLAYTFNIGELVGEIGNSGVYFAIGTDYSGVATSTGDLKLFFWDADAYNNSGSVSAHLSVVPEPANVALIAMGLGAFALSRRRKV